MATGWQPRYKPGSEFGNHEFTALCRHCGWFAKNDQFSLGVAEMVRARRGLQVASQTALSQGGNCAFTKEKFRKLRFHKW